MLRLYYTGALSDKEAQRDGRRSLGGFISSTEVGDEGVGEVFRDISRGHDVERDRISYCFALYNDSDNSIEAMISAHVTPIKGEVVLAGGGGYGTMGTVMLALEDARRRSIDGVKGDTPFSFSLSSKATNTPSLSFGVYTDNDPLPINIASDAYMGLWICRKIDRDTLASNYTNKELFFEHIQNDSLASEKDKGELTSLYSKGFKSSGEEEIRLNIKYQ